MNWKLEKIVSIAVFLMLLATPLHVLSAGAMPVGAVISPAGDVIATTPFGQHQTLQTSHPASEGEISFEDLNFDGYTDIKIFSSEGNVQRFYDVYLFNPATKKYEVNRDFSQIPCIEADIKNRQVVGQCFHSSACENWVERYSVDRMNGLHLVTRQGTYCDPSSGAAFSYVDRFKNGRQISSKITPLKDPKK